MGKKTISDARMAVMLRELREMKATLLPDEADTTEEEMKGFDDFQKGKARLNAHLHALTESITELNELRKKLGGARNVRVIALQNENHKSLVKAKDMWIKLKQEFEKQAKKKKLGQEELDHRRKVVELFGKELVKLEDLNSRVSKPGSDDVTNRAIERNRLKAAERATRRQQAKDRRRQAAEADGTAGKGGSEDVDIDVPAPMSDKEQAFMQEKAQNDKQIDELLDVINAGLVELKSIAVDINTNLDVQNEMLAELDEKIDGTITTYKSTNKRLKELIESETGGANTWCPILVVFIILLGIVGYIIHIAR